MSFESFKLDPRIVRGLSAAGYEKPTPVQAAAIPVILSGRDAIATAQTGTGKTAAFVLPMLHNLLAHPLRGKTRALIVTPTRELAEQIHEVIKQLGKHLPIRSATVYGGVGMQPQVKALQRGTEIIVACPGRLLDHVQRNNAKLGHVDMLVLDEADRMLDMGFWPSIRKILEKVPAKRQTLLFSATFNSKLGHLVGSYLSHPKRITQDIEAPADTVAHALYPVSQTMKPEMLLRVLKDISSRSVLIFTRTKRRADRVSERLEKAGYSAVAMHADKPQNQRQRILDQFKAGKISIMVATDIAARGLDIETISHVINYDMPDTATSYIHRIGRTGRAERTGDAVTLSTWEDDDVIRDLDKILGSPVERKILADFQYDEPFMQKQAAPVKPKTLNGRHTTTVRRRM